MKETTEFETLPGNEKLEEQHNEVVAIAANIAHELGEKEEAYYEGLRSRSDDPAGGD